MRFRFASSLALIVAFATSLLSQTAELTVVNAGPTGELQELGQANEIRVMFSEPMIPLGQAPANPVPAWARIAPAIKGTFRWSGTSMLLFTPDGPLPFATRYRVTIDATAEAVSGRRLGKPYEFSFTTPTVRLTSMRSARRDGRFDSVVTLALQFNQPVRATDVLSHATVRYTRNDFTAPSFTAAERARLMAADPDGVRRFDAKVADARRNASRTDTVPVRIAPEGERPKFAAGPTHVVLQTTVAPPPGTALQLVLDARMPSPAGAELPGIAQSSVTTLPPAFFVDDTSCAAECNPSSWQIVRMTQPVPLTRFSQSLRIADITDPAQEQAVARTGAARPAPREASNGYTVEDAGFERQPPARTWALHLPASLQAEDGQTLDYPWVGIVENWNERALTSFGDGHGVWESSGGPALPFYSRNYRSVVEQVQRVGVGELVQRLVELEQKNFEARPSVPGTTRRLQMVPNRIQSHGFDLKNALGGSPRGIFWAGLQPGDPIERSHPIRRNRSTVVQVTNMGVTVKDSPQSTLVFVTRLDNGEPVGGARVSLVNAGGAALWRGTTGVDGVAMAPALQLRKPDSWYGPIAFVAIAEKDGDVAYTASNWFEGISPWDFRAEYNLWEATDILRASIFTDRGVYKAGETVQIKAIVRSDTPRGVRLFPLGAAFDIVVRDARNKEVDKRTVKVNRWSSAEWSWTVPSDATLGQYQVEAWIAGSQPKEPNDATPYSPDGSWLKRANGGFLVAAYRRPDFEVNTGVSATRPLAGESLAATVRSRYLFGGTMANRPATWSLTRTTEYSAVPESVYETYPRDEFTFGYFPNRFERLPTRLAGETAQLDSAGRLSLTLPTERDTDQPYRYTFEADVEDLSRQHIANRASVVVHPASIYLGVRHTGQWITAGTPAELAVVAVNLEGRTVPGITVTATLLRQQWNSVRRAEGGGFYTWESERIEEPAGEWQVTTASTPVPLVITAPEGGSYIVRVTTRDADGRRARTERSVYAVGNGYTAWERFDHNRIELEPERRSYKPGETARILIKSPWERATALLTTEREGIRRHRRFTLTSTQQSVDVPITEADIPNVYVSVLLIRGRTSDEVDAEGNDPGRPAFRLGYVELPVEDATKLLGVKVSADRAEYRPANNARVSVAVTDSSGKPARSEVTLWAVDTGVLALTDYGAPDVARAIHVQKALQVMNTDNRQRLISRRVLTPKGEDEGGGGGAEGLRTDFRPLAFWLGSIETDRNGRATRSVSLPDTLTTYRIMAVAGDTASRFGTASTTIKVTKPITLVPALPRFLALSDRASFGALVSNTLQTPVTAVVTVTSVTPALLEFGGSTSASFDLGPGATTVARFDAIARGVGNARVRVNVRAGANNDAFEMALPVGAPARMETTAAFGETTDKSTERLSLPAGIVSTTGGLTVDLSSTALVGLGEGARYLADYPYFCAEQKASAALALTLAADLGTAFSMGRIAPAEYRVRAQEILNELPKYQCADGGFGYWPGGCRWGSFYLTSYVLHVMKLSSGLGMKNDTAVIGRALDFLEAMLTRPAPREVQALPGWTASAAYGVKVLTDYGRNQDGNVTRLVANVDRFPIFALSYLADAMAAGQARHARYPDVVRRIANAVRVEGDRAHVQELDDAELMWLWNSNPRSTAIVLEGLVRRGDDPRLIPNLVRGLLLARRNGRWSNTQENAWALASLVAYYRKYEAEIPDMTATVALDSRVAGTAKFRGRSSAVQTVRLAMPELVKLVAAGTEADLVMSRSGTGRLYYTARLQYVPTKPLPPSDQGMRLERRYERVGENGVGSQGTSFAAGDLIRVTLTLNLPAERRYVAVSDPLAAGFEPVDSWFRTTASDLARDASTQSSDSSWDAWWRRGGFDYIEKHDDRVSLFATRLSQGRHEFSYLVRATTSGVFTAAGAWAEEMYSPEVNGRSAPATITIK